MGFGLGFNGFGFRVSRFEFGVNGCGSGQGLGFRVWGIRVRG